jgi:glycosyltransferase involved in cell wall biosynthesis
MDPDAPAAARTGSRLRIALPTGIFPPDIGGPASYVPRIAAALAARGHSVEVITLADDPDAGGDHPFPVFRLRRGTARIPRMIRTVQAIAASARAADVVYANGLFIEAAVAAAWTRKPLAMKIVGDWAWERAQNRKEGSLSIEEFQSRLQPPRSEAVKRLRSAVTRRAKRIITPSRFLRRIVAGWGMPEDKISVVYNALEPPPEGPPADLPSFSGRTLITVARLVRWKGIDSLLEILQRRGEWRLLVVGDGPERENLEALAVRLGLADRVTFTGGVPRSRVFSYMRAADLFVLNSLYEGLPHIVLEAFAAGLPVLATSAGGTEEAVEDGVNGLLIPCRRNDLLTAAADRIFSEPGLRESLVAGGRRTLQNRFLWETMVNQTESVLSETASGAEGGR